LIVAAILTPTPDVATQLLLAGPLYFLYEISIIIVRATGRKDKALKQAALAAQQSSKKPGVDSPTAGGSNQQS